MKKRELNNNDVMARIILIDGTEVFRDGNGRYRDVISGKYLKKTEVESRIRKPEKSLSAMQAARKGILEAVSSLDKPVESVEEAWARLVEIQTEIALDIDQGSKATTALKFLGSISGLDAIDDDEGGMQNEEIDPETARVLLKILEEFARFESGGEEIGPED